MARKREQDTYSSSTSSYDAFLFLLGLRDPKSKTTSASSSAGGGEADGVRVRLDEEEADDFFFATAAFTSFFAAAALVWRADPSRLAAIVRPCQAGPARQRW